MRLVHPLLLSIALLSCALCVGDVQGGGNLGSHKPLEGAQTAEELRMTASISERKYCDHDYLRMTVRLNYENTGRRPIILYKYSVVTLRYLISSNIKAAEEQSYMKEVAPTTRPILPGKLDVPWPDSDSPYVILQPGESYSPEIETSVHLLNISNDSTVNDGSLRPGNYVLEIVVKTWYGSSELAAALNERWKQLGSLWTKALKSQPMPFKIEGKRNVVNCLSETGG